MDQRFDQVEKQMVRMETTQQMFMESTNQRFEQMLNMMDQPFAEQHEDINQRFEQTDKRFAEMMSFLQIITGIFTVIMAAAIGFAFWDRRTTASKAKEVTLEALAKDEESRKNALAEQVVAEVFRRLEPRKTTPPQSAPLPTMS
jgi:nitrate reductase NapE component